MTFPEQLQLWNRKYDALPEEWRFQAVLWPLIGIGFINMALTVSFGFPFALLVVLALIALVVIRVPYVMQWIEAAPADASAGPVSPKISISAVPWVWDLNLWYDRLPETRRPWVIVAVLVIAGGLNMLLTIHNGFSFGILFLLALLVILLIRAPYVAGWLIPPTAPQATITAAPMPERIAQETPMAPAAMHFAPAEPAPVEAAPAPAPIIHEEPPPPMTMAPPEHFAPDHFAPEQPPPHDKPA